MSSSPNLLISSTDADRIERLLERVSCIDFPGKPALESELARAQIVDPQALPANVVSMNSTVRFRMSDSDETFCMTLVYPRDANAEPDRVSILAPVGSALLGLSEGDEILWPRPDGGRMSVRIDEVIYQPERAGEFHR